MSLTVNTEDALHTVLNPPALRERVRTTPLFTDLELGSGGMGGGSRARALNRRSWKLRALNSCSHTPTEG